MSYSIRQVYQLARSVGLGHQPAMVATAIAMAESHLDPNATGDVQLEDATWGPSLGLWQIRSLKSEHGTGRTRDATRLKDPSFNARSMATISSGGTDFGAWSTYKAGLPANIINAVRDAVGAGDAPNSGINPVDWGLLPPMPDPGDILGGVGDAVGGVGDALGDVAGGIGGKAADIASGIVSTLVKEIGPAVLVGAGVLGGFAIIAIGAWRGSAS